MTISRHWLIPSKDIDHWTALKFHCMGVFWPITFGAEFSNKDCTGKQRIVKQNFCCTKNNNKIFWEHKQTLLWEHLRAFYQF